MPDPSVTGSCAPASPIATPRTKPYWRLRGRQWERLIPVPSMWTVTGPQAKRIVFHPGWRVEPGPVVPRRDRTR